MARKIFVAAIFLMAILASFFALKFYQQKQNPPVKSNKNACLKVQASSTNCDFRLENAATPADRSLGLSGRESLAPKTGMIFTFDSIDDQCMWMKDMLFSIDMIWLNEKKEIVKIENSVAPETYPNSFCAEAKYVIELSSGDAKSANLIPGRQLIL